MLDATDDEGGRRDRGARSPFARAANLNRG
jgi:hypothetical protein